jgi:23S rRNA (cytosine1962-C5)-methyltransferase
MSARSQARHVVVTNAAAEAARRGHPWIWRQAIVRGAEPLRAGDEAVVRGEDGAVVGRALADPDSPIALRMWTTGDRAIDDGLFGDRIEAAVALRARLFPADDAAPTTAYRVLHGEGDRCPGFVADRYGGVVVLRTDGAAARARRDAFARALWPRLERAGGTSLVHREDKELATLHGEDPPPIAEVREHGVPFVVDLARGQKTGAFLDQRENRRRVGALARGRRVLNLFSYAGGFSLRAALGGASRVTSVDVAAGAHATAQASFRLAGVEPRAHDFVTADVFRFLADAKARGDGWDLVVSDPPSFAPNERSRGRAIAAYRSLHRACAAVLAPDGIFCAASCSSHVDAETFLTTLDDASLGTSALRLVAIHGPPADHPTLPAWPEGRYLKFAVLT